MLQSPHVLLTFDKVHNPLRLPRETTFWDFLFFDFLSSFLFSDSSHLCFSCVHIVGSSTSKLVSVIIVFINIIITIIIFFTIIIIITIIIIAIIIFPITYIYILF